MSASDGHELALPTLTSHSICSRADVQESKLPSVYGEFHPASDLYRSDH